MHFEIVIENYLKLNKMKKIIYLSLAIPLLLLSCESTPEAFFFTDTTEPEVGHEVFFTNDSRNAKKFEWDFGDGYISNDKNPVHIYTATGTFEVKLTAISKSGLSDEATLILDVMIPTLLEIEVVENNDNEYVVPDASVRLYPTLPDWDNETNLETEGFTDASGIVVFSNLEPFVYYVDVWEETHDNWGLGMASADWIRTPEILPHKINRFIAWVDVVSHAKGTGRGDRTVVIKRIESKVVNKRQPPADAGTEGWQELYNRRANR